MNIIEANAYLMLDMIDSNSPRTRMGVDVSLKPKIGKSEDPTKVASIISAISFNLYLRGNFMKLFLKINELTEFSILEIGSELLN